MLRHHCILPTRRSNQARGRSLAIALKVAMHTGKFVFCASNLSRCGSHHRAGLRGYWSSHARSRRIRARCVVNRVALRSTLTAGAITLTATREGLAPATVEIRDGPHSRLVGDTRYRSFRDETTRRWHYLPVYRGRGHDAASVCRSRYGARFYCGGAGLPRRADDWLPCVGDCRAAPTGEACALKPFRRSVDSSRDSERARSRKLSVRRYRAAPPMGR